MGRLIVNVDGRVVVAVETTGPDWPLAIPPHVGEVRRRPYVFRLAWLVAATTPEAAMNVLYQDDRNTAGQRIFVTLAAADNLVEMLVQDSGGSGTSAW